MPFTPRIPPVPFYEDLSGLNPSAATSTSNATTAASTAAMQDDVSDEAVTDRFEDSLRGRYNINFEECGCEGPFGSITINPDQFIITSGTIESPIVNVSFNTNARFRETSGDISGRIFLLNSQEDPFTNIDFQIDSDLIQRFNIVKDLVNSAFSFTIPAISVRDITVLNFKIITTEDRSLADCSTINVDAVSSGFGCEYSYFRIEENLSIITPPSGSDATGSVNPPPPQPEPLISSESRYTFYDKIYETLSLDSRVNENILPNINIMNVSTVVTSSLERIKTDSYKYFRGLLDGLVRQGNLQLRIEDYFEEYKLELKKALDFSPLGLDNFSISSSSGLTIGIGQQEALNYLRYLRYLNNSEIYTLFPTDYEKRLNLENEKRKFNFPMYLKLFYSLSQNNQNSAIDINSIISDSIGRREFNTFINLFDLKDYFYYCLVNEIFINNGEMPTLDFFEIINKYFVNNTVLDLEPNLNNSLFYLGQENNIKKYNINQNNFEKSLFYLLLTERNNQSSITTAYNESNTPYNIKNFTNNQVLMYEIIKKRDGNILQRYYFINNFESSFLNFIDTQVKYDTEYVYEINKIIIVNRGNYAAYGQYVYRTTLQRINIDQINLKVVDLPPVIPEFYCLPYKGVDNKFLMLINNNYGTYEDHPIIIEDSDTVIFDNNRVVQRKQQNEKIKFRGDDIAKNYEIFRLDREPKDFQDFKNGVKISIETTSNSNSRIEEVEPNKKYYYILRSKDVHNNLSNPTRPLEIQIVNEGGTIFMRKQEYIFKGVPKNVSKTIKRFLKIKPSQLQSQIIFTQTTNRIDSASDIQNSVSIGQNNTQQLWEKTFLLKVTSKNTGKKIDIKFRFLKSKREFDV